MNPDREGNHTQKLQYYMYNISNLTDIHEKKIKFLHKVEFFSSETKSIIINETKMMENLIHHINLLTSF